MHARRGLSLFVGRQWKDGAPHDSSHLKLNTPKYIALLDRNQMPLVLGS